MTLNIELAVSLAGLDRGAGAPWSGDARAALRWAAGGFRAVALDGSVVRARDLDRSARRDLGATMRRLELVCAGIDLWIPPEHFSDPARQDRAIAAVTDAAGLCADLRALGVGGGAVSVVLPGEAHDAVRELGDVSRSLDVPIADHRHPTSDDASGLSVGLDPATLLLTGADPSQEASRLGERLACSRLSDADHAGRTPVGRGRLDVMIYKASLATAGVQRILLDLRGIAEQGRHAGEAAKLWRGT